jgi:hypothetical protein
LPYIEDTDIGRVLVVVYLEAIVDAGPDSVRTELVAILTKRERLTTAWFDRIAGGSATERCTGSLSDGRTTFAFLQRDGGISEFLSG